MDSGEPLGSPFARPDRPANMDAEQALIGVGMTYGERAFARIGPALRDDHFSHPGHGALFRGARSIIATGGTPDPVTLGTVLRDDPDFAALGGMKYLLRIYAAAGTVGTAGPEIRIWRDDVIACWRRRRKIELGAELAAGPDEETAAAIVRDLIALDAESVERPLFPVTIASELAGKPIPEQPWLVPGWVPRRQCVVFSGSGGVGKSQLAGLQLQASAAVGAPWLGLPVERVRSLGIYCEDDKDELHRRLATVAASMDRDLAEFGNMAFRSAICDPHEIVEEDGRGGLRTTSYFDWMVGATKAHQAQLLILDSSANLFAGDEIKRRQVRTFLTLLNRLAIEIDGTVLLLSHPSAAGTAARTGNSGSTHWRNGVRSVLYMERDPDPDADPDTRLLTKSKANYSRQGDTLRLQWRDGVFYPLDDPGSLDRSAMASKADRVFLSLLQATYTASEWVSPRRTSNNFAATVFAKHPGREGVGKAAFEAALYRLQQRGAVVAEEYGPRSKIATRLRAA